MAPDRVAPTTLGYGPVSIRLESEDAGAGAWLEEVLAPCFTVDRGVAAPSAGWCIRLSAAREGYAELLARRPPGAPARACFALDQAALALPAWHDAAGLLVADAERWCVLRVEPSRVHLVGDPRTRRWRFTAMWVCHELAATRLRRTHLDVHAASVETGGRAVLVVGPKGAGKTTLSLQLARAGGWRLIANDRAFVGPEPAGLVVRGVPTAVKLRPPTLADFPELRRGLPPLRRPYLYTRAELATGAPEETLPDPEAIDLALSPPQLAAQLSADRRGSAPLGAVVFPEVGAGVSGWAVERLAPEELASRLAANLYGGPPERRGATIFEDLEGDRTAPPAALAGEIARSAPGYRLAMGPGAHAVPGFAARLRDALVPA